MELNFNTSHVTVYLKDDDETLIFKKFQYIPCYGLSITKMYLENTKIISIHPMLRFIGSSMFFSATSVLISIHPMLRFIFSDRAGAGEICCISIHPMLRFILHQQEDLPGSQRFQYIPCYGLSITVRVEKTEKSIFQYIPCYGLSHNSISVLCHNIISIHPMLRFILCGSHVCSARCKISIHPMLRFIITTV